MQPGTRLGHYEILARLGAGGMGEVYRALDTKLGRAIALKVLPAHLSTDEAQLARLQREARALASLNHPRIATIHALEQDGEVCFLALELIDGETLAESVRAGPLPVDRALHIATQIADGLEGAHEAGIIHRDLKPANVMVTARGDVKILDFGLAKPWHPAGESPGTAAATLPESITEQGRFVGTVPYMSPEHVRGETLDRRTDIWAFGCVLFELLCAQRAFPGATPAESIAAVLKEEPDWEALPPELPAEMERTLRRCLDKDLDRRLRDIADARIEIADCIPGSARGSAASSGGTRGRPQRRPQPAARLRPSAVALAVAAVAVIAGITYMVGPRFDAPPDAPSSEIATTLRRVSILLPEQAPLDIHTSAYRVMALSPDGSQLVYRTPEARLYLRALDRFDSTPIPGTDGADYPFISPDGEWVGFITAGRLKKVRLAGGDPVTVTDVPVGQGATWTPDGGIVFTGSHGLWIVPADGGPARVLTNADVDGADEAHDTPAWLPGGKVVFRRRTALDGGRLAVVSVDGGQVEVLEERGNRPRYLASGHLMFSRPSIAEGETLYVRPFDPSTSRFTGPAVRVLECLRPFVGRVDAPVAISANGVLAYLAGARTLPTLVWVDEAGVETELTPEPRDFKTVSLSPDGTRIASTVQADGQNVADIWMVDAERGTAARFTSEAGFTDGSLWSPDGEWLLHYQLRPRQPGSSIVRRRARQRRSARRDPPGHQRAGSVSLPYLDDTGWQGLAGNDPASIGRFRCWCREAGRGARAAAIAERT